MMTTEVIVEAPVDELKTLVARKVMTTKRTILPFADFTGFMTDVFKTFYKSGCCLVGAGHVTPEIEIAADRAEIELVEALGTSPFASDVASVLAAVKSPHDLIYISNPNRITGANYSLTDLEKLARAIPQGIIFVDEYYFDYYGITGFPLLDILTNVVIIRSFTAAYGITSSDTGYVLANPSMIDLIKHSCQGRPLSSTTSNTILSTLVNEEAVTLRLREIHEESLRLAKALSLLAIQCWITTADFILLRVANPKNVGNYLARCKTPVENLDGYPQLKHYLRYRVQSVSANEGFIEAFKKMPADYYRLESTDRRAVTIRRPVSDFREKSDTKDIAGIFTRDSYPRR